MSVSGGAARTRAGSSTSAGAVELGAARTSPRSGRRPHRCSAVAACADRSARARRALGHQGHRGTGERRRALPATGNASMRPRSNGRFWSAAPARRLDREGRMAVGRGCRLSCLVHEFTSDGPRCRRRAGARSRSVSALPIRAPAGRSVGSGRRDISSGAPIPSPERDVVGRVPPAPRPPVRRTVALRPARTTSDTDWPRSDSVSGSGYQHGAFGPGQHRPSPKGPDDGVSTSPARIAAPPPDRQPVPGRSRSRPEPHVGVLDRRVAVPVEFTTMGFVGLVLVGPTARGTRGRCDTAARRSGRQRRQRHDAGLDLARDEHLAPVWSISAVNRSATARMFIRYAPSSARPSRSQSVPAGGVRLVHRKSFALNGFGARGHPGAP